METSGRNNVVLLDALLSAETQQREKRPQKNGVAVQKNKIKKKKKKEITGNFPLGASNLFCCGT